MNSLPIKLKYKKGYSGPFCTTRVPFCSTGCQNGGTCTPSNTDPYGGSCACVTGFTGPVCEVKASCSPNPCLNNQQCLVITKNIKVILT